MNNSQSQEQRFAEMRREAADLRAFLRTLPPPSPSFDLLLKSASDRWGERKAWKRQLLFPPCSMIWAGPLLRSAQDVRTLHVEVLVMLLEEEKTCVLTFPITELYLLSVARVLKVLPGDPDSEGRTYGAYGSPDFEPRFSGHEWDLDACFGFSDTCVITAQEAPVFAISALAGQERFADSPLYVVFDYEARKLLIIPCWEIFRFYYGQAGAVVREAFLFPRWDADTLTRLIGYFDGHRFQCSSGHNRRDDDRFVQFMLHMIGRDAVIACATKGYACVRAIPPFWGLVRIACVGMERMLGDFTALFVQRIDRSQPSSPNACFPLDWRLKPIRIWEKN
jgi:hypothetical protein